MKKTLKKRAFISAIAMLIVSAIVLTSSTFAWFAMATQVNVDTMELNITSVDGIVFSANTSNWTTKLTYDDLTNDQSSTYRYGAYEDNCNNIPEKLAPVSSICATTTGKFPVFYQGSIDKDKYFYASAITDATVGSEVGDGFVAFDLFIKLAEAKTVTWSCNLDVNDGDPTDSLYAMRVGIVKAGTVDERATADTILAKSPSSVYDMTVWEMDNKTHIATSGVTQENNAVTTKAIAKPVSKTAMGTAHVYNETANINEVVCNYATLNTAKTISCGAGVTRIRVYIWLEGQDVDCESAIAGSVLKCDFSFSIPA